MNHIAVHMGKPRNGSAPVSLALALPNLICKLMSCLCFWCWILHHELKKTTSSPLVACEHQCAKQEPGLNVVVGCEARCVAVVKLVSDVFERNSSIKKDTTSQEIQRCTNSSIKKGLRASTQRTVFEVQLFRKLLVSWQSLMTG